MGIIFPSPPQAHFTSPSHSLHGLKKPQMYPPLPPQDKVLVINMSRFISMCIFFFIWPTSGFVCFFLFFFLFVGFYVTSSNRYKFVPTSSFLLLICCSSPGMWGQKKTTKLDYLWLWHSPHTYINMVISAKRVFVAFRSIAANITLNVP